MKLRFSVVYIFNNLVLKEIRYPEYSIMSIPACIESTLCSDINRPGINFSSLSRVQSLVKALYLHPLLLL